MTIGRDTVVLFDASCLVAAGGSSRGGSAFVLRLCARGYLRGAVSRPILAEAERNTREKMGDLAAVQLERLLLAADLTRILVPVWNVASGVNEKDRHVVAAAVAGRADVILTLDRPLASEVNLSALATVAMTPGDFIRQELPTHPDFPFAHH
ncbi:MAG: PIN domain-containing protein [Dehalococcoidia bacterium]